MPGPRLRTLLSAVLTLVVLGLAGAGLTVLVRSAHDQRDAADLAAVARKVELPAGAVPVSGVAASCPTNQYVRCGIVDLGVDEAAVRMATVLEVVAERHPSTQCETLPNRRGLRPRDCMIRLDSGREALFIWVSEGVTGAAGEKALIRVADPSHETL